MWADCRFFVSSELEAYSLAFRDTIEPPCKIVDVFPVLGDDAFQFDDFLGHPLLSIGSRIAGDVQKLESFVIAHDCPALRRKRREAPRHQIGERGLLAKWRGHQ